MTTRYHGGSAQARRFGPSILWQTWAYRAATSRDLRLDFLRGLCLFIMIVDHIAGPSWLRWLTGDNSFYVSAAEGFVFISGLLVGTIYRNVIVRAGFRAAALVPLFDSPEPLHAGLERYVEVFEAQTRDDVAAKLGLRQCEDGDVELMNDLHGLLAAAEVDMTIFFRDLADVSTEAPSLEPLQNAFYDPEKQRRYAVELRDWLERHARRVRQDARDPIERRARMNAVNPRFVLRNYLAQEVIDRAEQGDYAGIPALLDVLRRPYDDQLSAERYAQRRPDWARHRAGCSMLSCSS